MKRNISLNSAFFLLLAFSLLLPSCSEDLPGNASASGGQSFRIHVDDGGYPPASGSGEEGDAPQTRASEENYQTVFTAGDKIGVFVVKEGEIVDEINNLCLTATSGSPGSLTWEQEGSGGNVELPTNATYYAYYPWQDNLTGKLVPTAGNAADFFANVIAGWTPASDQSDYAKYTAQDLMIADGSLSGKNLIFSMVHQMSLVVIDLPRTKYTFQNSAPAIPEYIIDAPDTEFDFKPCRMSGGTYRYLVNSSAPPKLSGSYTNSSKVKVSWKFTPSDIPGGNYKIYKVDNAKVTEINDHTLQAGDFFMKDGSLLKEVDLNDINALNVLGIVFWVGDPTNETNGDPTLAREKPGCTHGLVVALEDIKDDRTAWQNSYEDVNSWVTGNTVYSGIQIDWGDNTLLNQLLGYNNTEAIRAYNKANDGTKVLPIAEVDIWAEKNKAPLSSSGWYLPSVKELSTLCSGWKGISGGSSFGTDMKTKINSGIDKLNEKQSDRGKGLTNDWYWSSSEFDQYYAWGVYFYDGYGYVDYYNKNLDVRARAVLAF